MTTQRKLIADNLQRIFKEVTEVNAKWHLNPDGTPKPRDPSFETRCILLMRSELMEAFEGIRKGNQPDSHLPQYPTESVELADLFIRGIDFAAFAESTVLYKALVKNIADETATKTLEGVPQIEAYAVLDILLTKAYEEPDIAIATVIDTVIGYCDLNNIPLFEIYQAKTEYNRNRADHKPEARASVGGKQF